METIITPTRLSEVAGISVPYASQILSGKRRASSEVALKAFRTAGVRLGLLADMSEADIEKLCSQCVHDDADAMPPAVASSGKASDLTAKMDATS